MKIKLGIFFGGKSVEHEISVITMSQAISSLNPDKYDLVPIYIAKSGVMYWGEDLLDLQSKYIIYKKTMDGKYEKDPVDLNTHSCSYEDFFYKYDKAVDYLGLQRFKCMKAR